MKYLIANWKMQLTPRDATTLAEKAAMAWSSDDALASSITAALCPSAASLSGVARAIAGSPVALGAQDCFWEDRGAYTGETSPLELQELGVAYCIVGHSERRQHLGETDAMARRKTEALLANGIAPVLCVGETAKEREAGRADEVIVTQLRAALDGARLGGGRLLVAYEPRWAIGTGVPVAPEEAARVHSLIRAELDGILAHHEAGGTQYAVLYGGSVDPDNAASFAMLPEVEGVLVGGASLTVDSLTAVARALAAAEARGR